MSVSQCMSLHNALIGTLIWTMWTHKGFHCSVSEQMAHKVCLFDSTYWTMWTCIGLLSRVGSDVDFEVFFLDSSEGTIGTGKGPLPSVRSDMLLEVGGNSGAVGTRWTLVSLAAAACHTLAGSWSPLWSLGAYLLRIAWAYSHDYTPLSLVNAVQYIQLSYSLLHSLCRFNTV